MNQSFKPIMLLFILINQKIDIRKNMNLSIFSSFLKDISKCITFITKLTILIDSLYPNYDKNMFQLSWRVVFFKRYDNFKFSPKNPKLRQKRPEMNPMGQYFGLGTSKFDVYALWGFQKCMLKKYIFRFHGTSYFQID